MNFLQAEFERRKTKNPAYSIRAFARDLELSPGHLSHLITGKRKLSYPIALALLEKFGYSEKERAKALQKIKSESLGEDFKRKLSQPSKEKIYKDLNVLKIAADKYLQVCHWHHDAVFHLLKINAPLRDEVPRLARQLTLSAKRIKDCIKNLESASVISIEDAIVVDKVDSYHMDARKKEVAIAELQRTYKSSQAELLNKSLTFLDPAARPAVLTSHYLVVPDGHFAEFADMILAFAIRMEATAKARQNRDGKLHALLTQLFPIEI